MPATLSSADQKGATITVPSRIDQYSVATVPIEMMFGATSLSAGTAFVWKHGSQHYLVTNWHNVSGKDQQTKRHLSKTLAEPDRLIAWWNQRGALGHRHPGEVLLKNEQDEPSWLVHPQFGSEVDLVAIPVPAYPFADMHPINEMPNTDIVLEVGADVFILGYPFGLGPAGLPIWKRGSIASEPQVLDPQRPMILVDTASRPGMSGSPVIRRATGGYGTKDAWVMSGGPATSLVGIYSGRLATADPNDPQLGIVWPTSLIEETIVGGRLDK